ncbi:uncharacterized protein LOC143226599 isoform X2 [Tachypleus tridentatus]|uniref:uncharacterized protein LOC143226599 isoform X2 n=1 Tax=Tachypleus tridentatus TaxID=6853 RepID=UPI003FD1B810
MLTGLRLKHQQQKHKQLLLTYGVVWLFSHCIRVKFTGREEFIPLSEFEVEVRRVETVEDILTHGAGGIGLSVGVMGLVGVSVKTKVAVTKQTTRKSVMWMSRYRLQTGVITLRDVKEPAILDDSLTSLYLSEIVVGGEEMLLVSMEFNDEKTRVEVEITIKIKILFFTISAKMNFIKESKKFTASVEVIRLSSWRGPDIRKFAGPGSLSQAIELVENFEAQMKNSPEQLRQKDIYDHVVHMTYIFSPWDTETSAFKLNKAVAEFQLEQLQAQEREVSSVMDLIDIYVKNDITVSFDKKKELLEYKNNLKIIKEQLRTAQNTYVMLSPSERENLRSIYGHQRAPNYFKRKLKKLHRPPESFCVACFTKNILQI